MKLTRIDAAHSKDCPCGRCGYIVPEVCSPELTAVVLTDTGSSDYLIWGVAGLLYIWDSARLLSARQLLLVEASRGRLSVTFADSPYTITGRILAFCPLFRPYRGAFVAPWGQRWDEPSVLDATLGSIAKLRNSLLPVRVLATWSFMVLFIVGPILTLKIGPNAAVVYTAICVYWTVLMARREPRGCISQGGSFSRAILDGGPRGDIPG